MTDGRRRAALRGFLKKHRALLASVLLLAALIALLARAGGRSDRYIVEAEYDEGARQLRVHEVFRYTNRTGRALEALCFNLWPNAYAEEGSAPVADSERAQAYPDGFSAGGGRNSGVLPYTRTFRKTSGTAPSEMRSTLTVCTASRSKSTSSLSARPYRPHRISRLSVNTLTYTGAAPA